MPSKSQPILPSEQKVLIDLGARIKLARLRRGISAQMLAERSSVSRMTLHRAEKGNFAITMGTYFRIMAALQLQDDFNLLAKDDELGRRLQDRELVQRRKRSRQKELTPTAKLVKNLAEVEGLLFKPIFADHWANVATALSDDNVQSDATDDLLVELTRSGKLSPNEMAKLVIDHHRHLKHV